MSDIITFDISTNQYITDILYDSDHNLYVNSANKDTTKSNGIGYREGNLTLLGCSESYDKPYKGVSVHRIEVKDDTIKMELQTKGKVQSRIIKDSAAKCGFKVK